MVFNSDRESPLFKKLEKNIVHILKKYYFPLETDDDFEKKLADTIKLRTMIRKSILNWQNNLEHFPILFILSKHDEKKADLFFGFWDIYFSNFKDEICENDASRYEVMKERNIRMELTYGSLFCEDGKLFGSNY